MEQKRNGLRFGELPGQNAIEERAKAKRLPPIDQRLLILVDATKVLVEYEPSRDSQIIGTLEGWVPALCFVKVNPHTKEFKVEHIELRSPEL